MKIDAHQHFWHYSPATHGWITEEMKAIRKSFLPDDLASVLNANGVDGCVAVQADQTEAESQFLLDLAAKNPFIKAVVGWTDLKSDSLEARLEAYQSHELLKGFRHIAQGQPAGFLIDPAFSNGIAKLNDFGFSYDILVFNNQLPEVVELMKKLPEMRLVLDHIGKPNIQAGEFAEWKLEIERLSGFEHLYVKLSGLVTEANWQQWQLSDFEPYIESILEAFGPDRIMFGSDWPVCLVAADYGQVLTIVNQYIEKLSTAEQAAIMGENAERFYRIRL